MTAFRYKAVNLDGAERTGVLEADTQRQAKSQLLGQGLYVTQIGTISQETPVAIGGLRLRIKPSELALLTRQWATLLDAGLPIERTLAALIEQHDHARTKQVLAGVRGEVVAGHPLYRALERFNTTFNPLYRALVEAGEQSGQLGTVMVRLADSLENSHALRQKMMQAMIYPIVIVIVAILVVFGLMIYVVPQVVAVFQSGKQALPFLTQALIFLSDILRVTWPFLFAGSIILIWFFRRMLKIKAIRYRWHQWLMRLPVIGRLLRTLDSARLAQTLAILINSGVPILTALTAGKGVLFLLPLQKTLSDAYTSVSEGISLHRALAADKQFPPLFIHMVGSGEQSGQLGELLDKAARQQETELSNRLALAMGLLEPILILAMGVIVLVIVLAILQPIIEINQLVQ